ncbi:MAG: ATP-binding protein [Candidatus Omnitrophota bacterium]
MIQNYFAREDILDNLNKRLNGFKQGYRQNIAIIGDELTGKTSLLHNFLSKFNDPEIIPVYLELRQDPTRHFFNRFIGTILYNFSKSNFQDIPENLDSLISINQNIIPETINKIKNILSSIEKTKEEEIFLEILDMIDNLGREANKFIILIFDEFQYLEELKLKNLYREWSKKIMIQKNIMYVVTSSYKFKARSILTRDLALLFGNFEIIDLEPFDIEESNLFIQQSLQPLNLEKNLVNFLIHFTGGHPFYLKIILQTIQDLALKNNNVIDSDIVINGLENILFDNLGMLNLRFLHYLDKLIGTKGTSDYLSILFSIANGHNKLKDIAFIIHKQRKDISIKINRLLELDVISKTGDFFKINDRLFCFWLKYVYQEKLNAMSFDTKASRQIFIRKINRMINDFILISNKELLERVMELFRLFNDESVQLEKKKFRLNHFKEIKPLQFDSQRIKEGVLGRSTDSLWITALKKDKLNEEDIVDFINECKKYKHKVQHKIIIAFNEADTNVKLLAKEEKIWTWNIANINYLLDLYSKPRIVL